MADRERLRAERKRLDTLLAKIDGILGSGRNERSERTGATVIETPVFGMGLRQGILKVLADNSDGMRPVETAKALKAIGWNSEGKTPFPVLVSNQLWRMAREENPSVRRSEKTGKYKLLHGIENKTASG